MTRTAVKPEAGINTRAMLAPAKLNLTLSVHGRRADGFHDITSLVVGVGLYDRVACERSFGPDVELTCTAPGLCGPDNLACRAAEALAGVLRRDPGVRIRLRKVIPVGGGLGGGSSDAAAVLRLCNSLWEGHLSDDELAAVGARVGSDVPLFLHLPSAVMHGRGERVDPVAMRWSGWALLVNVPGEVSTARVYQDWRTSDGPAAGAAIDELIEAATADQLAGGLFNALAPSVFRASPQVQRVYGILDRAGLGPMHVTGAGGTMFRLFDHREEALALAQRIRALAGDVQTSVVAAPVSSGPVHSEE